MYFFLFLFHISFYSCDRNERRKLHISDTDCTDIRKIGMNDFFFACITFRGNRIKVSNSYCRY
jgi:hypothetical protein